MLKLIAILFSTLDAFYCIAIVYIGVIIFMHFSLVRILLGLSILNSVILLSNFLAGVLLYLCYVVELSFILINK
jgi:hypothetical protein